MNLVPLSSIPIEVRKNYALALTGMGILDGWEALLVTVAPDDILVPELDLSAGQMQREGQPRERPCEECGVVCWSKGPVARCVKCYRKTRRSARGYCRNGHAWTPENVYTRPNGHQYCRICSNLSKQGHRARYGRRDRKAA